MKILVVDDDSIARFLLEATVKKLGHEVAVAASGDAAWRTLDDAAIQVVLADWWMPGKDGLELCRRIRARGGDYVYFILVTNQADTTENFRATQEAGVDDFLTKPVRPEDLAIRLRAASELLAKRT